MKGKLSPRNVDPYKILQMVIRVAYELRLHSKLCSVHTVFPVYILNNCIGDPESILPIEFLGVVENISYEDVPVEIIYRQVRRFSNKEVTYVKVLWRNHLVEGSTWEADVEIKSCSPHLFDNFKVTCSY